MTIPPTREHFQLILAQADERCFEGKGIERHADAAESPFAEHDFWPLFALAGSGGPIFQIMKKLREYQRTGDRNQLLDVIVYADAMVCQHDVKAPEKW